MTRAWIAVGLLAASWLWGSGLFHPARPAHHTALLIAAVLLLAGSVRRLPRRAWSAVAFALLAPAVWFVAWPYKCGPLLMATGAAMLLPPLPGRWLRSLAAGAMAAGVILVVQAVALTGYIDYTSRSHDLPWPLAWLVGGLARVMGIDGAVNGAEITVRVGGQTQRLVATWELLCDPATCLFFFGGLVLTAVVTYQSVNRGGRLTAWLKSARALLVIILVWFPLRAALMVGLFFHRAAASVAGDPLIVANQFLSSWLHSLLLIVPVAAAIRFIGRPVRGDIVMVPPQSRSAPDNLGQAALGPALLVVAGLLTAFALLWIPAGTRKEGRVMVVEKHSTWEPTNQPYDTQWYGERSTYNMRLMYEHLDQYYDMSHLLESDEINAQKLDECDVLIIKNPTARYSEAEVAAVVDFVERGGSLLLIGEHTNFENSSTFFNDISRHFGFTFRHDLLFKVDTPYWQTYRRPSVPHPAVQDVPPLQMLVSASIDPGRSSGQAVMADCGLWSLPPDYFPSNYFPAAEYRPDMRYGAFVQTWATSFGRGRVMAFTDSTVFSNFAMFEEGKPELIRGMVEWLNRRSVFDRHALRLVLTLLGLGAAMAAAVAGIRFTRIRRTGWFVLVSAIVCGWTLGSLAVAAIHRASMPPPQANEPRTTVVIDRTVSDVPLSRGPYVLDPEADGFGMAEMWIPRLGYVTSRRTGAGVFGEKALLFIYPNRSVPTDFRDSLVDYVRQGGHVLVLDSPSNNGSTANSLLRPFDMALDHVTWHEGDLNCVGDWPNIHIGAGLEVRGGEPIARVGEVPVAARTRLGEGTITAVGIGFMFSNQFLGGSYDFVPGEEKLPYYELFYAVIESSVTGEPLEPWQFTEPPKALPEDAARAQAARRAGERGPGRRGGVGRGSLRAQPVDRPRHRRHRAPHGPPLRDGHGYPHEPAPGARRRAGRRLGARAGRAGRRRRAPRQPEHRRLPQHPALLQRHA